MFLEILLPLLEVMIDEHSSFWEFQKITMKYRAKSHSVDFQLNFLVWEFLSCSDVVVI